MHMQYFMETMAGQDPSVSDLIIRNRQGNEERAYGIINAKRLANWDRAHTPSRWSSRNCEYCTFSDTQTMLGSAWLTFSS